MASHEEWKLTRHNLLGGQIFLGVELWMDKKRVKIPESIKTEILFACRNTCPLCLSRALPLQIHHIDENPSNNDIKNLIPVCPTCHSLIHTKPTLGTLYTPCLLCRYRDELISFYAKAEKEAKDIFIKQLVEGTNEYKF